MSTVRHEQRTFALDAAQLRQEGDKLTFNGHAAVFGALSEEFFGGWRERIAPGAFAGVLGNDVRFLVNHDTNRVLGRTRSGTLELTEDERGLRVESEMAPTSYARDLAVLIERRDVDQMSFGFTVAQEQFDQDLKVRTILEVKRLYDVSVVTFPAYPATDAQVRNLPPLAPLTRAWDPDAALDRVRRWASLGDGRSLDWDRYAAAFAWADPARRDHLEAYRLLIADVVNGELRLMPDAVVAASEALAADPPAEGAQEARDTLGAAFLRMREELGDERRAPWEHRDALETLRGLTAAEYGAVFEELRAGKVLSAKNEKLVREAFAALEALLKSLDAGDEAKSARAARRRQFQLRQRQLQL